MANLGRELGITTVLYHAKLAELAGLSVTDYKCLDMLSQENETVTAGHLAEMAGLSTAAITGVVDRLERAGYVRRVRDQQDRRRILIELVPSRMDDLAPVIEQLQQSIAKVTMQYTPEQLTVIASYLEGTIDVLRSLAGAMGPQPKK
jgi:DNA-binding MarR family transcriptional regulator